MIKMVIHDTPDHEDQVVDPRSEDLTGLGKGPEGEKELVCKPEEKEAKSEDKKSKDKEKKLVEGDGEKLEAKLQEAGLSPAAVAELAKLARNDVAVSKSLANVSKEDAAAIEAALDAGNKAAKNGARDTDVDPRFEAIAKAAARDVIENEAHAPQLGGGSERKSVGKVAALLPPGIMAKMQAQVMHETAGSQSADLKHRHQMNQVAPKGPGFTVAEMKALDASKAKNN